MKIILATPFYPPDTGGIANHVEDLKSCLICRKHSVTVLRCEEMFMDSYRSFQAEKGSLCVFGVRSFALPRYPYQTLTSFRIPLAPNRIASIIDETRPDVIHVHGHHYPISWLVTRFANKKRVPVVLTIHGLYALTHHKTLAEEAFNNTVFKWLLRSVNAVICTTQTALTYVKKYAPESKCYVIPYGFNYQVYQRNLHRKLEYRQKYRLPIQRIIVLYSGRFVHVKGISELVEAYKIISVSRFYKDQIFFLFVGGGVLKSHILRCLKGEDNYKIIDWVNPEQLLELNIASDIQILPSKWAEGFGIVLLEAMGANLFIVATHVGGVPDVLAGYSKKIYINTPTPIEIAMAIKKALIASHAEMYERKWGYNEYIKNFEWTKVAERIEDVYRTVTGSAK